MEELDFDDEVLIIHPDEDIKKIEAIETDANSNLEQPSESDSGEIEDDEEANDLEEGEIKDGSPVAKKKSEIACRFFKRGSCVFGSQCQYLHVSDTVYKMFDTNPQRRNVPPVEPLDFPKPIIFPPNILPPRPFIEPPILVAPKPGFHRLCDTVEDNWEKGLEQARILIQNSNLKKKNEDSEAKKISSKNNKGDNTKGQYFTKENVGNEVKKYGEKALTNNSLRREGAGAEKKSNFRYQSRSSDKWVDPWRRSKSPLNKKRPRSVSGSPRSRSRKHSYASSTSSDSSSSSEFDSIYGKPYERKSSKSPQRSGSKSRSFSQSQHPKKRRISPKRSFNGRRYSRSLSRSPYKKRTVSSRTRSRSSSLSSSSSSDSRISPTPEEKEMKRISDQLDAHFHQKSPERASPLADSDCETSELTVSSASCTSVSSDSEIDSPRHGPSLKNKRSPNRNNASFYSKKPTSLANPKVFNRNQSNLWKKKDSFQRKDVPVPAFQKKTQPFNNGTNLNNRNFKVVSTNCQPKNTTSYVGLVKKPASAPAFTKSKMSGDMELLFSYQGLKKPNNNRSNIHEIKPNIPVSNPNVTDDGVKVENRAISNSESNHDVSTERNIPKQNIVLNLKPKSKDFFKPESLNKPQDLNEMGNVDKKDTASKREQLLNKLKLIDDAIARKKASNAY